MLDADVESVGRVIAECYRLLAERDAYTESERNGLLDLCSPEAIRQRYVSYDARIAGEDGEVLGVIAIEGNEIAELFVRPDLHGRGIGSLLVRTAEDVILSRGHDHVNVRTATAPGFYDHLAYTRAERCVCAEGPLKGRILVRFEKRFAKP